MKAPNFSLPDQNGTLHKLSDYSGKWLLVYFYPKDDTLGCTKEACSFRDSSSEFKRLDVQIVGISKDNTASHKKFEHKFKLNFPLLSDESGEVIKAYGAWGEKSMFGKKFEGIKRNSYLINPKGEIEKVYEKVNPLTHSGQVLKDLKELK